VHIARQYLEPQSKEGAGIPGDAAQITDLAMQNLINEYARFALCAKTEVAPLWMAMPFVDRQVAQQQMAPSLMQYGLVLPAMGRESGVRNLKKQLEKIYRKVALKLVKRGVGASQQASDGTAGEAPPLLQPLANFADNFHIICVALTTSAFVTLKGLFTP
jgi:Lon-like ATP-dependent protease